MPDPDVPLPERPDPHRHAIHQPDPRRQQAAAGPAGLTRRELVSLPAVVDVPTAAKALSLSRTAAYELIRAGDWPTPVFRLGRRIRVPTAPILQLLGIGTTPERPPSREPVDRRGSAG